MNKAQIVIKKMKKVLEDARIKILQKELWSLWRRFSWKEKIQRTFKGLKLYYTKQPDISAIFNAYNILQKHYIDSNAVSIDQLDRIDLKNDTLLPKSS